MSSKIRFFLVLIIAFALVLGFIWFKKNEAPDLKWSKGTNVYRLKVESRTKYLFSESEAFTSFSVEGDINFTVLDFDDSSVEVLFSINDVNVFIDGEPSINTGKIYKSGFAARLDRSGRFKSFSFPGNYSKEKKRMIKGILLHFEVICTGEKKFEVKQDDSTGTYLAKYDYSDNSRVVKKKTGYKEVLISESVNANGFDIDVIESDCFFNIQGSGLWLKSFEGKEKLLLKVSDKHKLAEIETKAALFKVGSGKDNTGSGHDYDYYESYYKSLEKDKPEPVLEEDDAEGNDIPKERKIEIMKDMLSDITNQSPVSDSDNFKDFLRQHPEIIEEIPDFLKKGEMEDKHAYLVGILGVIGTPEAQNALCSIFSDFSQSYKNRDRAVVALGSLDVFPEQETIDAVEDMLYSIQPETDDNDIAGASLFSLGIISSNIRAKYSEKADEIDSLLELYLKNASNDQQKYYVLGALGNTGSAKAASEIIPFLRSEDKDLRRSAAEALYVPDSEQITESLVDAMEKEDDSLVKSRIMESLSQKNISEEKAGYIAGKSLEESDPDVRRYYIYFIDNNKDKIKNLDDLIESLLRKETSRNNIKALLEIDPDR